MVNEARLRLPPGVRDRVARRAEINRRSVNAQIVHYIDRGLAADENESPAAAPTAPGHDLTVNPGKDESEDERT